MHIDVPTNNQAWAISGNSTVFSSTPTPTQILDSLLNVEEAYWLDRQCVAIQPQFAQSGATYAITSSLTVGLSVTPTGITGGTSIPLTVGRSLTTDELLRYPQLSGYTVLSLPANVQLPAMQSALRGQLAFSVVAQSGSLTPPESRPLVFWMISTTIRESSASFSVMMTIEGWRDWDDENCDVKLKVWVPTAQSVSVQIFDHESDTTPSATVAMHQHNGVWVADGKPHWKDKYHLYSVKAWVPADSAVDTNLTSDPYSIDIALNSTKKQNHRSRFGRNETRRLGSRYFAFAEKLQRPEHLRTLHP